MAAYLREYKAGGDVPKCPICRALCVEGGEKVA